ncbi:MAG: BMP family ABC transporter substrate-binding protein [Spirochaetia bacterium]|jgi:basic membrane protein A|nr:BMP family ABC transporter substrate-binding protein [Spirochaetia bacterium]
MKKGMKLAALVVAAAMILTLASCKKEEKKTEEKKFMAAMATDVGGLGDKSFNDGAHQGLEMVREKLGADIKVVESKQQTDYVPNLIGLAEDGSDIVFAVGFLMEQAVKEAAKNNPDTKFAGIDIWAGDNDPANFMGILYKEHESGYLAGVVAGMMTKEHSSASPRFNDKNVVGVVLGMFIPPVEKFEVGFIQGVKSVNPDCKVLSVTTGSFVDQAKGKEAALAMIEQGADIVFQVAGLTGLGVIQACKEKGVAAIGVDVDQSGVAPDTVLTSAVKQIPQTVFLAVESVKNNTFTGGTKVYGIEDDATGISPFHDFESVVPQAVKEKVAQVAADMKAGKIKIETTRAALGM